MSLQEGQPRFGLPGLARPDPAVLAIAAVLAVLAIAAPGQAVASLLFTLKAAASLSPFFALSVALTAYVKASGADNLIARAFAGNAPIMVLLASLMGTLSPFCSCGVIPIVAALLASGVPLAPVMAFWIASPLMDPSMFVLTTGFLGLGFAAAKTAAAIGMGMLGGFLVMAMQASGLLNGSPLRSAAGDGGAAGSKIRNPGAVAWRFWEDAARGDVFRVTLRSNALFLGKWLLLAFLLESLMVAYVPADLVARIAGEGDLLAVVAAAAVGIPSYLNGSVALPLVAGLVGKGMAPGAAMAFLLAGGATSIPAALGVHAVARRDVFAVYIAVAFVGAIAAGLAVQLLFA